MIPRINIDDENVTFEGDAVLYNDVLFNGVVYELDANGELLEESEHINGLSSGFQRYWQGKGILLSEHIPPKINNPHGRYMEWHKNGILKKLTESFSRVLIRQLIWNEQGILVERWESRNDDEWNIFSSEAFKIVEDKRHGTNQKWFDNGSPKEIESYIAGELVFRREWDFIGVITTDFNPLNIEFT